MLLFVCDACVGLPISFCCLGKSNVADSDKFCLHCFREYSPEHLSEQNHFLPKLLFITADNRQENEKSYFEERHGTCSSCSPDCFDLKLIGCQRRAMFRLHHCPPVFVLFQAATADGKSHLQHVNISGTPVFDGGALGAIRARKIGSANINENACPDVNER